jgi:hypothetical protein
MHQKRVRHTDLVVFRHGLPVVNEDDLQIFMNVEFHVWFLAGVVLIRRLHKGQASGN